MLVSILKCAARYIYAHIGYLPSCINYEQPTPNPTECFFFFKCPEDQLARAVTASKTTGDDLSLNQASAKHGGPNTALSDHMRGQGSQV